MHPYTYTDALIHTYTDAPMCLCRSDARYQQEVGAKGLGSIDVCRGRVLAGLLYLWLTTTARIAFAMVMITYEPVHARDL